MEEVYAEKEIDDHKEQRKPIKGEKLEEEGESEYGSADEESYIDDQKKSGCDTDSSVGIERESGDGQESAPAKKVDDDEDKKNPQYIPKRGTFYEHDDRTADDVEEAVETETEKGDKDSKKKVWQDKKERWSHDKFNDSEQAPKSRAELVAIYGYDIRNEDGPPRARRRRRYGRGPNKYTRNWEDEDAYNKPPAVRVKKPHPRKPRHSGDEEYPPLTKDNNIKEESDIVNPNNRDNMFGQFIEKSKESNGNSSTPSGSSSQNINPRTNVSFNNNNEQQQEFTNSKNQQARFGSGRVIKPKKEIKDSDYKGFTSKTRQIRNIKTEQKIVPRIQKNEDFVQSQNFTNKNSQNLEAEMSKLNIESSNQGQNQHQSNKQHQIRQGSVPPRLQTEQKGSKRYSSIRQRSLPEASTPPYTQHSNYYSNEFNQQSHLSHPSTTQIPPPPQPALATLPQVPVTATQILQAPPQFGPPYPQGPPPFLQPNVAPPPFLPSQTAQIINYVPGQPQFTQSYQGFQQQFNPVQTQPDSMYPPPTGITYYSTDQQISQRTIVPQKRPKAAIPIVAPPSSAIKKSGKAEIEPDDYPEQQQEYQQQIDEFVENSNGRKLDPVTQ